MSTHNSSLITHPFLRSQFDRPVSLIQKVLPNLRIRPSLQPMQRMPLRAMRLADQAHVGLVEQLVAFSHGARGTGADDGLPCRLAAARDRDDVVERQLGGRELSSAVLAAILVAQIDVAARELHFLSRQTIEREELD